MRILLKNRGTKLIVRREFETELLQLQAAAASVVHGHVRHERRCMTSKLYRPPNI